MKAYWIVLAMIGFSLRAPIPVISAENGNNRAADVAAIRRVSANVDAAYNRRDAVAFSAYFLEDADFQWHTGALLKNREEIRRHFAEAFKTMPADYRHITTLLRIRFLSPDIAVGDGTVVIARAGAADNEQPYMKVLMTGVAKKDRGQWRIAAIRLIPIIQAGAP